ncbi:MFS transporter [Novosphingobium sp. FKTRR1]|uniref:MFS transporter n=1 Tax=Novosphingobium sp. FKTRR1 TaxID=2879118 RepID=UPI001CF02431|nr:MFS transporter [Novosphingobium sp. FKTRR1]
MNRNDPASIIEQSAMSVRQWLAVGLTIMLNALDGFDVLSSAFAGPGIKQEWHLGPDGLGAILSMELIGMGVGSVLFGGWADKYGRRPTTLGCLLLMAAGMLLAARAGSPQELSAWRVLTGLGIGGMLAAINAIAFELSSLRHRSLAMALMVIGYPVGAFLGGLVAAHLLQSYGWRSVFLLGGGMTVVCIPLLLAFVPEPPPWLARVRPPRALDRINRTLASFGHATVERLAVIAEGTPKARFTDIFSPAHRRTTVLIAAAYAAHALSFYFILKMVPAIMSDPQFAGQHFTKSQGAGVLAYANLGGAIGGAVFGVVMHKFGIRRATLGALALSTVMVASIGIGQTTLAGWTWQVAAIALCTNSAIVGFYAMFAFVYPTQLKATGTGFALTVGRGGAALAPYLGGVLFAGHMSLAGVAGIMAMGSLVALVLFRQLPDDHGQLANS